MNVVVRDEQNDFFFSIFIQNCIHNLQRIQLIVFNVFFCSIFSGRFMDTTEGYGKNKAGNRCIAICTDCQHGKCVLPEQCKCDPGYGGPACDISTFNVH